MSDVKNIQTLDKDIFTLDTGSPHFVKFVDQMPLDIKGPAKKSDILQHLKNLVSMSTLLRKTMIHWTFAPYEEVENETLTWYWSNCWPWLHILVLHKGHYEVQLVAKGGLLSVNFLKVSDQDFTDIWLKGNATFVFQANWDLEYV